MYYPFLKLMLRSYLCFLAFLSFTFNIYAQKIDFESQYVVRYKSKRTTGQKKDNQKMILTFTEFLLFDNKRSYFAENINYYDLIEKRFKERTYLTPNPELKENFYYENGKFDIFSRVIDFNSRYEEKPEIKWVLYGDKKEINGVECQLATTNKYGRRWYAYFALKGYDFPFGPRTFNGLPGLIFELYDTRDDYHFTIESIKKDSKTVSINLKEYPLLTKLKYLKAYNNLMYTPQGFPIPINAEQAKEFKELLEFVKKADNNPIELKPFE
jgi:GLPGLI family protein